MNEFNTVVSIETAVIPKGTVINGNIEVNGKLEMYGTINGDIVSTDRITVCGDINGNIKANDLYVKDSFIEGNIECNQGAVIRENTIVLGDMTAQNLIVDGAIQGKLDIHGLVTIGETAIIDSDIKAKSIQISNGAAVNGHCSLCYADIDVHTFFPETEPAKVVRTNEKALKEKRNKTAS